MIFTALLTGGILTCASALSRARNAKAWQEGLQKMPPTSNERRRIPILIPAYGRPQYFRRVLDSLEKVKGIERALVVISQDGDNAEVTELIKNIRFTEIVHIRHSRPFLGLIGFFWDSLNAVSANIHFLAQFAVKGLESEAFIVLEADLVVAPDFYIFFEWAIAELLPQPGVFSVTGFNLNSRIDNANNFFPENHPLDFVENLENALPKFTGWTWAMQSSTWRQIEPFWSFASWDLALDRTQRTLGMRSYKPILARAKNIGMQGGINFCSAEDDPKWRDVWLSKGGVEYQSRPKVLNMEPVVSAFEEKATPLGIKNEQSRTRGRRFLLVASVIALAVCEIFLIWREILW